MRHAKVLRGDDELSGVEQTDIRLGRVKINRAADQSGDQSRPPIGLEEDGLPIFGIRWLGCLGHSGLSQSANTFPGPETSASGGPALPETPGPHGRNTRPQNFSDSDCPANRDVWVRYRAGTARSTCLFLGFASPHLPPAPSSTPPFRRPSGEVRPQPACVRRHRDGR